MLQRIVVGIVFVLLFSSLVVAIHTPETRYSVDQSTIEQRNIYHVENRYGISYTKPLGGYGMKGASSGSQGFSGTEEGASVLETNAWITQGRDPSKISNYYSSARGYQVTNAYVELTATDLAITSRPQINGTPRGHARVISKKPKGLYLPELIVILRTRDLIPIPPSYIYEAWLVDEDTGTSMSLGIFQPAEISRVGTLDYKSVLSADPFETLMITTEPFPDSDPRPGQVVLSGDIKPKKVRTR